MTGGEFRLLVREPVGDGRRDHPPERAARPHRPRDPPAMIAGCTVVRKCFRRHRATATSSPRLRKRRILNLVVAEREVSERLVTDPDRQATFIDPIAAGHPIASLYREGIACVTLELAASRRRSSTTAPTSRPRASAR